MTGSLQQACIQAQAQLDRLTAVMDQLRRPEASTVAKVGLAAQEAEALAMALTTTLSGIADAAETERCRVWDFQHAPAEPFEVRA